MKNKFLVLAMAAAIVSLTGCTNSQSAENSKTAMQKKYTSMADCQKDFPTNGDCTRATTTGTGNYAGNGGGGFYMSPFFYPWGGVYHSNGVMSYNQRVPTSGYTAAPASVSSRIASTRGFSAPRASFSSSSTRGGFGGSARASSGGSFGG